MRSWLGLRVVPVGFSGAVLSGPLLWPGRVRVIFARLTPATPPLRPGPGCGSAAFPARSSGRWLRRPEASRRTVRERGDMARVSPTPSQDTRMAMTLTGYRASRPRDTTGTVRSRLEAPKRDRPQRRACTAFRDTRAPPGPAPDGLVIPSGGPLAAARHTGRAAGIPVKGRECVTAQGSEVEDRGRAPTELAARYSGATRTQPHEPSRSAGAIRSH